MSFVDVAADFTGPYKGILRLVPRIGYDRVSGAESGKSGWTGTLSIEILGQKTLFGEAFDL